MPTLWETTPADAPRRAVVDPSLPRCSRCERPSDDLLDRAHGERVCFACRDRERERYESGTGQCFRTCGYALAWHQQPRSAADACPTEAEARDRSGAQ